MFRVLNTFSVSDANSKEVLHGIQAFVQYFFGCRECSHNFHKMAVTIDNYVNNSADAILWLWRAHNKANARLKGDITEDPHNPKVQFPTEQQCPHCRNERDSDQWDETEVLKYLRTHYGLDNIRASQTLEQQNDNKLVQLPHRGRIKIQKPDFLKNWSLSKFEESLEKYESENARATAVNERVEKMRKREQETRTKLRPITGESWEMSQMDISVCVMVYITVVLVLVLCYYFFILRRRQKYVNKVKLRV